MSAGIQKPERSISRAVVSAVWGIETLERRELLSTTGVPTTRAADVPAPQPAIRINAGGSAFTDPQGNVWSADRYFTGGFTQSTVYDVAKTTSDPLYAAVRYGSFNYSIPVTSGVYTVNLHFADPTYTVAKKRFFNVDGEGVRLLSNFDLASSGGAKTALVKTYTLNVTDGTLSLNFMKGSAENPILSGIEVLPQSTPEPVVGRVASLTLINAASDQPIGPMTEGMVLDGSLGQTFNVRADPSGSVKSVVFLWTALSPPSKAGAPFCVAGDSNGDYNAWNLSAGTHTLTAIPYSGINATGEAGAGVTVGFSVIAPTIPSAQPDTFTQIKWATQPSATYGRAEALTGTWGSRVYVFGGFSNSLGPIMDSEYFDTATSKWTTIKPLPERITHAGMAYDAENAYFVAGYVGTGKGYAQVFGSKHVWAYNYGTNTYSALPDLPRALAGGGAALVGRELHYFGGFVLEGRADTNIHLVLNLDNLAAGWQAAPLMLHTRSHMGAVVYDGKIYAIAGQTGYDDNLTCLNYVEVYDPVTKVWSSKAGIPAVVSHMASATFIMGDRIIVAGGELAHEKAVRNVWAYTPSTDSWVALTALPDVRFSGVAQTINGKIYFTTGGNQTTTWVGTPLVPVSGKPK